MFRAGVKTFARMYNHQRYQSVVFGPQSGAARRQEENRRDACALSWRHSALCIAYGALAVCTMLRTSLA